MKKLVVVAVILAVLVAVAFLGVRSSLQPGGTIYGMVGDRVAAASGGAVSWRSLNLSPGLTVDVAGLLWAGADGTRVRVESLYVDPSILGVLSGAAVPLDALRLDGGAVEGPAATVTGLTASWDGAAGSLAAASLASPYLKRPLVVSGTLTGPAAGPATVALSAATKEGPAARVEGRMEPDGALQGSLKVDPAALDIVLDPTFTVSPKGSIRVTGRRDDITVDPTAYVVGLTVGDVHQEVSFPSGGLGWAAPGDLRLAALVVASAGSQIKLDGRVASAGTDARVFDLAVGPGTISLPAVAAALPASARASLAGLTPEGTLTLEGKITGTGTPHPDMTCSFKGVAVSLAEAGAKPLRLAVTRGGVAVKGVDDVRLNDVALDVEGIPLTLAGGYKMGADGAARVDGAVAGRDVPLALLGRLALASAAPDVAKSLTGTLTLDVKASTAGDTTTLGGKVEIKKASARLPREGGALPVSLSDVTVDLTADAVTLQPVTVTAGGLRLQASGKVADPLKPTRSVTLKVAGPNLPVLEIVRLAGLAAQVQKGTVSVDLDVAGSVAEPAISLTLDLKDVLATVSGGGTVAAAGGVTLDELRMGAVPSGRAAFSGLKFRYGESDLELAGGELRLADGRFVATTLPLVFDGAPLELTVSGPPAGGDAEPLLLRLAPRGSTAVGLTLKVFSDPVKGRHVIVTPAPLPLEANAELPLAATGAAATLRLSSSGSPTLKALSSWCRGWGIKPLTEIAGSIDRPGFEGSFTPDLTFSFQGEHREVTGSLAVAGVAGSVEAGGMKIDISAPEARFVVADNALVTEKLDLTVAGLPITVRKLGVRELMGTPKLDIDAGLVDIPSKKLLALVPAGTLPEGLWINLPVTVAAKVTGPWTAPAHDVRLTLGKGEVAYRRAGVEGPMARIGVDVAGAVAVVDAKGVRLESLRAEVLGVKVSAVAKLSAPSADAALDATIDLTAPAADLLKVVEVKLPEGMAFKGTMALQVTARGPVTSPELRLSLGKDASPAFAMASLKAPLALKRLDAVWQPGSPAKAEAVVLGADALRLTVKAQIPKSLDAARVDAQAALLLEKLADLVATPEGYQFAGELAVSAGAGASTTGVAGLDGTLTTARPPVVKVKTETGFFTMAIDKVASRFAYLPSSGKVTLRDLVVDLYGGTAKGEATLDISGDVPTTDVKLAVASVDLDKFLTVGSNLKGLMGGKLNIDLATTSTGLDVAKVVGGGSVRINDYLLDVNRVFDMSGWGSFFPMAKDEGKSKLGGFLMGLALDKLSQKSSTVAGINVMLSLIKRVHRFGLVTTPIEIKDGIFKATKIESVDDPKLLAGDVVITLATLALRGTVNLGIKDPQNRLTISNLRLGGTCTSPKATPANGLSDFKLESLAPPPPPTPVAVPSTGTTTGAAPAVPAPAPTEAPAPAAPTVPTT